MHPLLRPNIFLLILNCPKVSPLPNAILYESTVPLIFEGYYPTHEMDMNSPALATAACNSDHKDWCKFTSWIDNVDKNIENEILKLH